TSTTRYTTSTSWSAWCADGEIHVFHEPVRVFPHALVYPAPQVHRAGKDFKPALWCHHHLDPLLALVHVGVKRLCVRAEDFGGLLLYRFPRDWKKRPAELVDDDADVFRAVRVDI